MKYNLERMSEHLYTMNEVLELMAIALYHQDSFDWTLEEESDPKMIEGSIKLWHRMIEESFRHSGDCTNQPMTCCKCLTDQFYLISKNILAEYHKYLLAEYHKYNN